MARVTVHAVIEIEDKHAAKIARRFHQFLDELPAQIANVAVIERSPVPHKGKSDGKPVPRQPARQPLGRVEG